MDVLRQSALYAPTFDKKLPRLLKREYGNPNFPAQHLLKDVELFISESRRLQLDPSSLEGLLPILQKTLERGLARMDYSALFDAINPPTLRE